MRMQKDEYFIAMAKVVALRGTCPRRQVGCVLVDKNDFILSTGYNGSPPGVPHCSEETCSRTIHKVGEGLDDCDAIHAEQNALLQCRDTQKIDVAYVTTFPCVHCLKMLMNTSCRLIIFENEYKNTNENIIKWRQSSRTIKRDVIQIKKVKVDVKGCNHVEV